VAAGAGWQHGGERAAIEQAEADAIGFRQQEAELCCDAGAAQGQDEIGGGGKQCRIAAGDDYWAAGS
jgi:hypothetical protein